MLLNGGEDGIARKNGAGWNDRQGQGSASGSDAGSGGEEIAARCGAGYGRVYGWRAKHAVSLGHLDSRPFWLGLEPGRKFTLPLGLLFC
jgi:hypothetical protein